MIKCNMCSAEFPRDQFYKSKTGRIYKRCKRCVNIMRRFNHSKVKEIVPSPFFAHQAKELHGFHFSHLYAGDLP